MANLDTLMEYLQNPLPGIPITPPPRSSNNTTNTAYSWRDIGNVTQWQNFNLATILQTYQGVLQTAQLQQHIHSNSPPHTVCAEEALRERIAEYLSPLVRRALRCGFGMLPAQPGITDLSFGGGSMALFHANYKPDLAFFDQNHPVTQFNRAPGDIKVSWKWHSAMAGGSAGQRSGYKQVLGQLNFYMRQNRTRYGFVITDQELVCFRRSDAGGNLEQATPIPYNIGGTAQEPMLTPLLAMWYLGMLASIDQGYQLAG